MNVMEGAEDRGQELATLVPAQADVNGALKVIGAELDAVLEQLRKGSGPDAAASSPQVEVEGQVSCQISFFLD